MGSLREMCVKKEHLIDKISRNIYDIDHILRNCLTDFLSYGDVDQSFENLMFYEMLTNA